MLNCGKKSHLYFINKKEPGILTINRLKRNADLNVLFIKSPLIKY